MLYLTFCIMTTVATVLFSSWVVTEWYKHWDYFGSYPDWDDLFQFSLVLTGFIAVSTLAWSFF